MTTETDPATFQKGLFNLRTRRFGRVAELLIQKLIACKAGQNLFHDLYDDIKSHRIEVKFCTVNSESAEEVSLKNLLKAVEEAGTIRAVPFAEWQKYKFDANIQQIKRAEFEILYYGLFFQDVIVIFKIESDEIKTAKEITEGNLKATNIYFSNKQHKGNEGEGQFHMNNVTLPIHLKHFHYKTISYADFLEILESD